MFQLQQLVVFMLSLSWCTIHFLLLLMILLRWQYCTTATKSNQKVLKEERLLAAHQILIEQHVLDSGIIFLICLNTTVHIFAESLVYPFVCTKNLSTIYRSWSLPLRSVVTHWAEREQIP